jgi:hypothetical protein
LYFLAWSAEKSYREDSILLMHHRNFSLLFAGLAMTNI